MRPSLNPLLGSDLIADKQGGLTTLGSSYFDNTGISAVVRTWVPETSTTETTFTQGLHILITPEVLLWYKNISPETTWTFRFLNSD